MTFGINLLVVAGFVSWTEIVPQPDWLLIPPLLLELYLFTLGMALILTTLFVSLRDMGQVWELGAGCSSTRHRSSTPSPTCRRGPRSSSSSPRSRRYCRTSARSFSTTTSGITVTAGDVLGRPRAPGAHRDHVRRPRPRRRALQTPRALVRRADMSASRSERRPSTSPASRRRFGCRTSSERR